MSSNKLTSATNYFLTVPFNKTRRLKNKVQDSNNEWLHFSLLSIMVHDLSVFSHNKEVMLKEFKRSLFCQGVIDEFQSSYPGSFIFHSLFGVQLITSYE